MYNSPNALFFPRVAMPSENKCLRKHSVAVSLCVRVFSAERILTYYYYILLQPAVAVTRVEGREQRKTDRRTDRQIDRESERVRERKIGLFEGLKREGRMRRGGIVKSL